MHRTCYYLSLLLILSALAAAPAAAQDTSLRGTYTNGQYGFTVKYDPVWYTVQLGWNERSFQLLREGDPFVRARVLDVDPDLSVPEGSDLVAAGARKEALADCVSMIEQQNVSCRILDQVTQGSTTSGLRVLSLTGQQMVEGDPLANREVGPFFAIDITQQGVPRLLLFSPEQSELYTSRQQETLQAIMDSLELISSELFVQR